MITLRQLEALRWIAELGTFERAATKLNMTQSAISKRIQELEEATGLCLFDRSQRGARLTVEGARVIALGQEMLATRDKILDMKSAGRFPIRHLQLGVTELTALTWLPRLITTLRATYPGIHLLPEVDLSRSLFDRLLEGTIDIIVMPETFFDPLVSSIRLAEVQNSWMASPELISHQRTLSLDELGVYTILSQGPDSGSGSYFSRWLRTEGIAFERELSTNSLVALVGLTLAGLGVSYLPTACFRPLADTGQLRIIPTKPLLPSVPYGAMFRNDRPTAFNESVAQLMLQVCDFSTQYRR